MSLSDNELIIEANKGNDAAFEELIYRYDKSVLSIALNFVHDSDEAKDIYQEVFIRVHRSLKKFEMRSGFSTWLYRIATNVCLTHKSRNKKHLQLSINEEFESEVDDSKSYELVATNREPDELALNTELGSLISDAVDSLSPKQKITFTLKHYEGYKIREIAEMLNCKEGTVKKYLFDAIRNLRKNLNSVYAAAY